MEHQDWEKITITGNPYSSNAPTKKVITEKKNSTQMKKTLLEEGGVGSVPSYDKTVRTNLARLRAGLGLTQEALARQLAVPVSVIAGVENGKGKYDGGLVNKINTRYKVSLRDPEMPKK
jgi:ribosome-binding protein aMBF1 (putative translation factor)